MGLRDLMESNAFAEVAFHETVSDHFPVKFTGHYLINRRLWLNRVMGQQNDPKEDLEDRLEVTSDPDLRKKVRSCNISGL
jgi:hypothetical protein